MMNQNFPFEDEPNTATFICDHVMNKQRPILYGSHDEDGYWQFLCGDRHTEEQAKIVSLKYVYDLDPSIGALADLPYGKSAYRNSIDENWIIK